MRQQSPPARRPTVSQRLLRAMADGAYGVLVRRLANRVLGGGRRVVRVRTGPARRARLELDLLSEKAYWLGHYEPEVQALLRSELRPGDCFFDVGAHIGFFTVLAGRLGARVVAIEPDPANARRVERNASLNGVTAQVVAAAAWDEAGSVDLVRGGSGSEWSARPGTGVPSVTLDGVAAENGSPNILKLDVEGAEGRVLRGAESVLASRPRLLICEVHGDAIEDEVRTLLDGWLIETVGSPSRLAARPPAGDTPTTA